MASWPGVFVHDDKSMLTVYVDDLLMAVTKEKEEKHWKVLSDRVEFKEDPKPIDKFIGAYYTLDVFDPKAQNAPRAVTTSMVEYTKAMVRRFCDDTGLRITKIVDTPYISAETFHM